MVVTYNLLIVSLAKQVINLGPFIGDSYPTLRFSLLEESGPALFYPGYQPLEHYYQDVLVSFLIDWQGWENWNEFIEEIMDGIVNALEVQAM